MKKFLVFLLLFNLIVHPSFVFADDNVPDASAEAAQRAVNDAMVKTDQSAEAMNAVNDLADDEDVDIVDETGDADEDAGELVKETSKTAEKAVEKEADKVEDTLDDLDAK